MKQQSEQLIHATERIFRECVQTNGAITISPDSKLVIPHHAAFVTVAAPFVGLELAPEFFAWVKKTLENEENNGALSNAYDWEGKATHSPARFAPEQNGAMLWSIDAYIERHPEELAHMKELVSLLVQGITQHWKKNGFSRTTNEVWGEHHHIGAPEMNQRFTYALAACAHGLERAAARYKQRRWKAIAGQMREHINNAWDENKKTFHRALGKHNDTSIDSLTLGLCWPYHIYEAKEKRMQAAVERIEEVLIDGGGVHRFQYDYHDSEGDAEDGGGIWPALNFWMSIYFVEQGDEAKARAYFQWVLERVHEELPEQMFKDFRIGITPFAWSHALFLLAAHSLKLLPNEA
ncbi:MAG: hypothetical protein H6760_04715 [Candidatus Nomurabacteria bacterium]|nr:MAG: hypothetical protein H6760_04715 [Candidatus Nomurabacteria bacterium]